MTEKPKIGLRNGGKVSMDSSKNNISKIHEEDNESNYSGRPDHLKNDSTRGGDKFPMRNKSTCCSEILLVSHSDMVNMLESQVGYKCDEAFLEESALKLLRSNFKKYNCSCHFY